MSAVRVFKERGSRISVRGVLEGGVRYRGMHLVLISFSNVQVSYFQLLHRLLLCKFFVSLHCALGINTNSCVPLFSWPAISVLP